MSMVATLKRFKRERVQDGSAKIVRETVLEFADQLVNDWSPLGNPELWKSPPPADYVPGNFRSSWFLSIGSPSAEKTDSTSHREVWNLERLADLKAGETVYLSNNADHASSLEAGHSQQAPVGVLWAAGEFAPMAAAVARRIAQ